MDNRPIGVFDSGLGGLNGLLALRRFLPDENIVYFADSGRLPYGAKARGQLREMAKRCAKAAGGKKGSAKVLYEADMLEIYKMANSR